MTSTTRAQPPRERPRGADWIITIVALFTMITPFLADWNETHLYNPGWTPHAKFHAAHTMLLGALLGGVSLWLLWRRRAPGLAILVGGLYWAGQAGAVLFPGTAFVDPEFADRIPRFGGFQPNQAIIDVILLGLLLLAGWLDTRRRSPGAA